MKRTITTREFAHFPGDWHLSPVLDTGDFVFFSGITGTHPDLSVAGDPVVQFRDTFRFLLANLRVAGLTFQHIVEMTTYHVDLRKHLNAFVKVKDQFITEPYPAWTAIGVTELITEGTLLEIRQWRGQDDHDQGVAQHHRPDERPGRGARRGFTPAVAERVRADRLRVRESGAPSTPHGATLPRVSATLYIPRGMTRSYRS
jgi:enamine deaminase RidA (YjgF/YER057c/UK114 family)